MWVHACKLHWCVTVTSYLGCWYLFWYGKRRPLAILWFQLYGGGFIFKICYKTGLVRRGLRDKKPKYTTSEYMLVNYILYIGNTNAAIASKRYAVLSQFAFSFLPLLHLILTKIYLSQVGKKAGLEKNSTWKRFVSCLFEFVKSLVQCAVFDTYPISSLLSK